MGSMTLLGAGKAPAIAGGSPEILSNPGFATDTVWDKGGAWSIAAGVATKTAGSSFSIISQGSLTLTASTSYTFLVDVSSISVGGGGSAYLRVEREADGTDQHTQSYALAGGAPHTISLTFTADAGVDRTYIFKVFDDTNASAYSIDNASAKLT